MTEQEWLACDNPDQMLDLIRQRSASGQASPHWLKRLVFRRTASCPPGTRRKLFLLAIACARRNPEFRRRDSLFEAFERRADELVSRRGPRLRGNKSTSSPHGESSVWLEVLCATETGMLEMRQEGFGATEPERKARCDFVRDIFPYPLHPAAFDQAWRSPPVVGLGQSIYADQAFDRLPILADALFDAGCTDQSILDHCRSAGPHVRGCWVVDLVLGNG